MKEQIKKYIKLSGLKYMNAFALKVGQTPSNFDRRLFSNIDRINGWLKEIGLELCVKEIGVVIVSYPFNTDIRMEITSKNDTEMSEENCPVINGYSLENIKNGIATYKQKPHGL